MKFANATPNYNACSQSNMGNVTPDAGNHINAFSYDASGNALGDGLYSYTYDGESEIKTAAGVTYSYDGDGRRVAKVGSKLYWYGSGGEILSETEASGNVLNEYVFFGGKRVALVPATGDKQYYVEDMLGSSRLIARPSGILYDADFAPFGQERAYTNSTTQTYKFEGKERDTETQNDDFGARYYTWRFGRWLSADWSAVPAAVPYANLTNPQTLNLYAMVGDDPESFADLDGHCHPSTDSRCTVGGAGEALVAELNSGPKTLSMEEYHRPEQQSAQNKKNPTFTNLDKAAAASARADQALQKKNGGEYGSLVYSADGKTFKYTTPVTQGDKNAVDPFNTTGNPQTKTDLRNAPIPSGTQLYAETHSHPDNSGFSGADVQRAHDLTIPYYGHPDFKAEYVGLRNGNVIQYDATTGKQYTFAPGQPQ